MHPKCEKANRAASFVLRIWWEEGGAKPIWRGRVQPRHLFFIVALALGVATAPPAHALTETRSAPGAADSSPKALDLKQAIDDFVANAGQPVSAAEIVSFLTGKAKPALAGSFGPAAVFNPAATYNHIAAAKLTDTKFVVAYTDRGNSGYGTAIVGQVSGTIINYGPESVFNSANTTLYHSGGVARLSGTTFVVGFENANNNDGRVVVGTVSGSNAITFGHQMSYSAGSNSYDVTVAALSGSKFVVAWDDESNSDYSTAKVVMLSATPTGVYLPIILKNH